MTRTTIAPLTFIAPGPLPADVLALAAATMTLMSACVFDPDAREDAPSLVAANLVKLSQAPGADDDFRRLCARLHEVWARAAVDA